MARATRRAPDRPAGGQRLPFELAPALSAAGLIIIGVISFLLLGGTLPAIPGGPGGPARTPTPSNIVIVDPRADIPGSLLYVKSGNAWVQTGDQARQVTTSGADSMAVWSPDGASIYLVRTTTQEGRWPSGDSIRTYDLTVPSLLRVDAASGGNPETLLTGLVERGSQTWSYFIQDPAISPDGGTAAILTDGPDPTRSQVVVKLLPLAGGTLTDPRLAQTQSLGHQAPAWSPDGKVLLYVRNAREGSRGTPAIYRYNLANGRSAALTATGYTAPAWSRDGRYVAATKTSNFGTDVVILDARDGSEVLSVTRDGISFSPVWSPIGDAVAFFKVSHGVVDLYLVRLEGAAPAWTTTEPIAVTIAAGLDATSRPQWFIPAGELPPLATPTPAATPAPSGQEGT